MRLLLDVNVLIALFDDDHFFNGKARALFARPKLKIATCPLVENGVMRVLNTPRYSKFGPLGFEPVRQRLIQITKDTDHQFWPDDVSIRSAGVMHFEHLLGHNQLTDAYLLALAIKHGGSLATFDQTVALSAVHGARSAHLTLL